MKINKFFPALFFGILFVFPACRETNFGDPVKQVSISRIDQMPNLPEHIRFWTGEKKLLILMLMYLISIHAFVEIRLFGLTALNGIFLRRHSDFIRQ